MFGLGRRRPGREFVERVHDAVVAASRDPALYAAGRLPDTVEGRLESLVLHVLVVLRRLRALPKPADDFAQEFIDLVFAHLEVALREMGVGDFGVPKRMKKLAGSFYDRLRAYEPAIGAGDGGALVRAIVDHLPGGPAVSPVVGREHVRADRALATLGFDDLLRTGPTFPTTLLDAPEPQS